MYWLNENSRLFLERGYLMEGVTPEERIREIADIAEGYLELEGFADKFYDYMSKGYYSLSSPIWSNFGLGRGLPISCFGSNIEDNMGDILYAQAEVGVMSKYGGGTSGYFGNLRERGAEITDNGQSSGAVHFMKLFETMTDVVSQGCYDDQTEVLTEKGFMTFEELMKDKTIKVAQVTDSDEVEFVRPLDYMKYVPEDNELLLFKDSKNIDLLVTKNHNMEFKYESKKQVNGKRERYLKNEYRTAEAQDAPLHRDVKYAHGSMLPSKGKNSGLTPMERLYIAAQADGSLVARAKDKAIKFRFAKKRKSDRIEEILQELGYEYSYNYYDKDGTHNIYVNVGHVVPKTLVEWVTVTDKSIEWAKEFLEEVSFWDGSIRNEDHGSFRYSSIIESNVDVVQMVATLAGAKSTKVEDLREKEPNKSTIYNLSVSQRSQHFGVEKLEKEVVGYEGHVYCVEVPSHRLIVRRGGHTVVCGNSTRRGRFSPYLPIEHPDIMEFLEIGSEGNPIQDLTHGVTVTDKWLEEMVAGDEEKRQVWAKLIQSRVEIGYPYIFFTDTVNRETVDVYRDKGLKINHSNLCVAPNTRILTDKGYIPIVELAGTKQNVWNGEEWSEVDVIKTGEGKELLKVTTTSGYELECTPYHKFYILEETASGKRTNPPRYKEVRASELKSGDKLIKFELPVVEGKKELELAYDNGFMTGDGMDIEDGKYIYLYGEKKKLKDHLKSVSKWREHESSDRLIGTTEGLKNKYFVPSSEYMVKSRLEWLSGYLDADGTVTNNNGSQSIQVSSINKEFLREVQLMLQTLGVDSKVTLTREEGVNLLPKNDGTGELGEYQTAEISRLLINGNSLYKLSVLGLTANRLEWEVKEPNREASHFIQVETVEEVGGKHDTYCFTEPKRHMGMFNGLLTGQCSEIALPNNDEWSFVCNLSSMNLVHYDEWKETDAVETLTYFLDAVMTDFITKLEALRDSEELADRQAFEFMKKSHKFAVENRALGVGALGWHSYLQSKMYPFESLEAKKDNARIFKFIQERTYKASEELAEIYGEPKMLKGYGRRNTTTMALAPTTSSAFILGQVSQSIEPLWSNYYVKDVAKAKVTIKNQYLVEVLEAYGENTPETWESIRIHDGSVQHLEFLTDRERDTFKTFSEIDQFTILDQASIRQQFIDQAQSLNIMVNPSTSAKEMNELYLFAWERGVKSLYYQHGTNAAQQFNQNRICVSCEA